jgi:hypothetical protein
MEQDIGKLAEFLERENDKAAAADPVVKKGLTVVREFLTKHPVMCYGGTAINNLLPPSERFYDPIYDVPDYDFFSKTPAEHAMMLANQLHEAGIQEVEVKPGVHLGTFKVFADYVGVADITELDADIFDRLWSEQLVKEDIHYVTPDFLRMSMYLELSRPKGDVSRWKKVYARLTALNKHYPIVCNKEKGEKHAPMSKEEKAELMEFLRTEDVVLLGATAAETHTGMDWTLPAMVLATEEVIQKLIKDHDYYVNEGSEILPPLYFIRNKDGVSNLRVYQTTACHSYHNVPGGYRVASIPTILQFFFAYMYSAATSSNIESISCIAQRLVDLADHKPKRRFALLTPIDCYGTQETLTDMRKHKAKLYTDLGKDKTSPDFLRYFFTYNPAADTTRRKKLRDLLKKTRKSRYGMTG